MDKIIDFPNKNEREWIEIERTIRELLKENSNLYSEDINYICERMKKYYFEVIVMNFSWGIELPNNILKNNTKKVLDSANESLRKKINEYVNQILIERLQLEIRMVVNDYIFEE